MNGDYDLEKDKKLRDKREYPKTIHVQWLFQTAPYDNEELYTADPECDGIDFREKVAIYELKEVRMATRKEVYGRWLLD